MYAKIHKKGEVPSLNPYTDELFDATYLAQSAIPQLGAYLRPAAIARAYGRPSMREVSSYCEQP